MLKKQRAQLILERLNNLYPETPVPLDHSNHFELLVAVLLSAQCTDERVNQVTPALFKLGNSAEIMQHVCVDEIFVQGKIPKVSVITGYQFERVCIFLLHPLYSPLSRACHIIPIRKVEAVFKH